MSTKLLNTKRHIVGLSGGVDSSVALYLTQQKYSNTRAVYIKNWQDDQDTCPFMEDCEYALQVCDLLKVPFHTIEMTDLYRTHVFQYFLNEYQLGRTPNPDILCNREIKFSALFDILKAQGEEAFVFVTGHYAQISEQDGLFSLKKAVDQQKDQTYFLHALNQKQLSSSIFPLGALDKPSVRTLAKTLGFHNHARKDSTGICFIGERKMKEFLSHYLPSKPGSIVDLKGKMIGKHRGIAYFTIGQRKGLEIGGKQAYDSKPWYVADKLSESNEILAVQGDDHPMLYHNALEARKINWISGIFPDKINLAAKIRYRQEDQACVLQKIDDGVLVCFAKKQWAVSLGQFIVFYDGLTCLGGGVIEKRFNL